MEILVPGEVHDHESTTSPQFTAPVLSQNGCEGTNDSPRTDIEVRQPLELGRACVRGNAVELRNLSILWPVRYEDATADILQGVFEPGDAESCPRSLHIFSDDAGRKRATRQQLNVPREVSLYFDMSSNILCGTGPTFSALMCSAGRVNLRSESYVDIGVQRYNIGGTRRASFSRVGNSRG